MLRKKNIWVFCPFFSVPVNVYFWAVVWYYFQRLGDPLDPIAATDTSPDDAAGSNSAPVVERPVVLAVADLEILENGKGSIERRESNGPNPFSYGKADFD